MNADLDKYGEEFEPLLRHHEDYKNLQVQIAEKRELEMVTKLGEVGKQQDAAMAKFQTEQLDQMEQVRRNAKQIHEEQLKMIQHENLDRGNEAHKQLLEYKEKVSY